MMSQKSIYLLALHESVSIGGGFRITRVPGGWLYNYYWDEAKNIEVDSSLIFVPYSKEFEEEQP